MYYPILRGKQFDLIAIRELVAKELLSESVIPMVEPIKPTPTLLSTLKMFVDNKRKLLFVMNPEVGRFLVELGSIEDESYKTELEQVMKSEYLTPVYIINPQNISEIQQEIYISKRELNEFCVLIEEGVSTNDVKKVFGNDYPKLIFVPDKLEFRRGFPNDKVILADRFPAQKRNADYLNVESQLFSTDHLYYKDENYVGFSDYSTIGKTFMDSGFAPYAVVIHIVYFDQNNELRIRHFTSEDNNDYYDPANKYYQALTKLVEWKKESSTQSHALNEFNKHFEDGTYPGLGVVKQLSIMHHMQIMGDFLQED